MSPTSVQDVGQTVGRKPNTAIPIVESMAEGGQHILHTVERTRREAFHAAE